jgi:hypothetical protein
MRVNLLAAAVALAVGLCGAAMVQNEPPGAASQDRPGAGRGMGRDFHGVGGEITAIEGSTITLQTFRDGGAKIKITSSTRLMKDGKDAKLSDFKVGDRVFASGEQDKDGVWTAQMLGQRSGAGAFPRGGGMGGMQVKPEDNGKTYILGELTRIDGTRLTIKKPDNTEQVIEVDEDTSFHNERRESVTLADLKVGDLVRGRGAVKSGVFVPKELNTGRPRRPQPGTTQAPPPGSVPQNQNYTAPNSGDKSK